MKTAGLIRRTAVCFLILTCTMVQLALPALAFGRRARKTVKVGVLNNTTYAAQDENGVWRGLDIECLIAISQKAGFDLEFIDSSNDPDFLGSLDKGTYDIVADVVQTPDRENNYLFTDEAIGNTLSTLAVRSDDDRWDYGNIQQISQMRLGVLSSYASNADFRAWCGKHDATPDITEYENIEQMTAALMNGEIDGEVYTAVYSKADTAKLRAIMKFLPESFYYAFRRDDVALKNQVDDALSQILTGNADYLTSLKNKYEEQFGVNELPFSAAEKEYIAAHPVFTIAVLSGDAPYYETDKSGTDWGILPDYYAMIAENTGFQFQYRAYPSQAEAIAAVKEGEADILWVFSGGMISSQQYELALTYRFSTANSILLTNTGSDLSAISSIAVIERAADSLQTDLEKAFPDVSVQTYETAQQCARSLADRNTSAILIGLPSATWLINQANTSTYSITPMSGAASDLCGAVDSSNQILCSILNKRIESTRDSFAGLVAKDTLPKSDWKTTLSRVPLIWTLLIVCALLLLVLGLAWTLMMLRRRQRERAAVLAAQAETEKQRMQVLAIQKSTEERNRFFANISHDMRTPLNAITNFIRLAQADNLSCEKRAAYLSKAESSSRLLMDLINDTLTVSRLTSGKLQLRPQPCRTGDLVESVVSPIREAAERKRIDFQVDDSRMQDQIILADKLNIEKIYLNLLTNAVRYTPEGGHIWYSIVQDSEQDGQLCYTTTVRDDGIGISPAFMPHLFEPFSQEKRPGYDSVGTGLGLSIVRQLVDLMGGSIEASSEIGKGTAFVVKLRFDKVSDAASVPDRISPADDAELLRGKKLLLCEDNALNQEIASALLNSRLATVVCADNGSLGVQLFSESMVGEYDAILMDIRMPVMDGIQAAGIIRALDRPDTRTIPIIAMTADAFSDDVQRCLDAGMNAHVAKPVEPAALYSVLAEYLAKQ